MPAKNDSIVAKKWRERGLTDDQVSDLIGLAAQLSTVTGQTVGDCLLTVDRRVREVLEDQLLGRVRDTITYGHDLGK